MRIYIGVENFAKIRSARIDVTNYALFVGENNSGKTYLMQLIYYVLQNLKISYSKDPLFSDGFIERLKSEGEVRLSANDIKALSDDINRDLDDRKDQIVAEVFKRKVNIDKLYVEFEPENEEISVRYKAFDEPSLFNEGEGVSKEIVNDFGHPRKWTEIVVKKTKGFSPETIHPGYSETRNSDIANHIINGLTDGRNSIYIPASRTGLLMLYRNFFAETVDAMRSGSMPNKDVELTTPVYAFLRFLQTINYKTNTDHDNLIAFAEEHIIDGHLVLKKDEPIRYVDKSEKPIPLVLSSSMVNEVTPMLQCIASMIMMRSLIIDEIETSLHPKKQREMARWLNRLNNAGYRLVVSTHSDTMAAYVNNLHILSMKGLPDEKLDEVGLSKEDMLSRADVKYYEFRNQSDGTSVVEELEFGSYPNDGVNFTQFSESADELYNNTMKILGIGSED